MNQHDLAGQVGVVTGAARGLGRAFALGLAQAGMSIAVTDLRQDDLNETLRLLQASGGKGMATAADVSDPDQVAALVKSVEEKLGPIDLLVNNAAVAGPAGPTWESDPKAWWRCQEVNLRGPFLGCHAVLPGMIARQKGRIINVASASGTVAVPYLSAYVTSKAALIRFTETLAFEARPHGVSIFAVHPGAVQTPMNEELLANAGPQWRPWLEHIFQQGQDQTTEPGTSLVLFLASGKADSLSGKFFMVPEDPEELLTRADEIRQKDLYTLRLRHPKI
ncbi:MAG TPA: SDR family oxidoreductase [Candidatus Angelobacter sp.]|nr:SDR family oxidoreductase [Candidatus Angelobacter sp.]